jgi:hypothetical protein
VDPLRPVKPGEPIDARHPIFSAYRTNLLSQMAKEFRGVKEPQPGPAIAAGDGGGGGVPCRIFDGAAGGGVSGNSYTPTATVRVMLEVWDGTKWDADTTKVINAHPLHAGAFSVDPLSGGACCVAGPAASQAGLVLNWSKGIVYDPDATAWVVTGRSEADSEVEVWLDAGTAVAATVSPDGTWTATLNLSAATRGVHSISAHEKFFGDMDWQTTRTHAVWREDAEADPALRKAVAPRPLDAITPDVQTASDLGGSSNDNRTSDLSPVIDCAIADPGAFTTHYGRLYFSKAATTVCHDEQDNVSGDATEEGDVFAFNTGSDGTEAEDDFVDGDLGTVQVDFWGVGGLSLELDTDDVHSGMSRPMLLRIDADETGEGDPTRYHLRGVLLQTGTTYHVQLPFSCLYPNTTAMNTALDA